MVDPNKMAMYTYPRLRNFPKIFTAISLPLKLSTENFASETFN